MKAVVLAIKDAIHSDRSIETIHFCTDCSNCIDLTQASTFTTCPRCHQYSHSYCSSSISKSSWTCSKCNECHSCHQKLTSSNSVECRACRNLFHFNQPACPATFQNANLSDFSRHAWKCADCLKCKYCDSRRPEGSGWSGLKQCTKRSFIDAAKWMRSNDVCNECYLLEEKGNQCPVCLKLYRDDDLSVPMIVCDKCCKWVHLSCDSKLTVKDYEQFTENEDLQYLCPLCIGVSQNAQQVQLSTHCIEKENLENLQFANPSVFSKSTPSSPYYLMQCLLCKKRDECNDPLQLLSPLDLENFDDCSGLFHAPDLFVHQKCLFYLIFGGEKLKSFEVSGARQKLIKGIDIFQKLLSSMRTNCVECFGSGASIYCYKCNGYLHYFCGNSHCHQWKPSNYLPKAIQNLAIERRFLIPLFKELNFKACKFVAKIGNSYFCDKENKFWSIQDGNFVFCPIPGPRFNHNCSRLTIWDRKRLVNHNEKHILNSEAALVVKPSKIAGIGVVAGRTFNPGEQVIEYIGEIIGKSVANQREKMYEKLKRGCYMFKISDDCIVDATMIGNKARFINHSCDPNCHTRNVAISKATNAYVVPNKKRIIIACCKRVEAGEEFSYDYKFPREDAKIPCNCGSNGCRKFMN